jgi:glycosyltransferase involved in cell wall biosynthesis
MKTIAVIFHDSNYYSGGTRSMLDIIDSWLLDQELKIICIFPRKTGTAIDYLNNKNVKIITMFYGINLLPMHWKSNGFKLFLKIYIKWILGIVNTRFFLVRKMKQEQVDLIYTNTSTPFVGAWLKKRLKIPHVWHFREFGEEDQDFTRIGGSRKFYQTVNSYSDSIVVISEALRTKVEKYSSLPISVIYDDLSPTYINPKEVIDLQKRPLRLLIAGSLSVGKGQIQVIEAVKELNQKKCDIVLYIAGTGPQMDDLKQYVQTHNLNSKIVFLGLVEDMNTLRKQIDIGVVCSRCEAFGRITIEGMLSNMVMIGADTGGTPELIQDGLTGFLYRWNDVSDLVEKIEYIYNNPSVAKRVCKQGFEFGLKFTKGQCADNCKALIMMCIEKSKDVTYKNRVSKN